MRKIRAAAATAAVCALAACSSSPEPPRKTAVTPNAVKIVNFYATSPHVPKGEKEMLCYGVENAKSVWLEPPRQELSAALSRCIDVEPKETTTYTLHAQGADGREATEKVTVTLGAARAKILEVKVSALEVAKGQPVSICWKAENAKVKVSPVRAQDAGQPNCVVDTPEKTTTYTVTATGAAGDQDHEKVTVKVK